LIYFFLQIIGALGLFALISKVLLNKIKQKSHDPSENQPEPDLLLASPIIDKYKPKTLLLWSLIYIALLSYPCMLLIFPLFLSNLVIGGSEVMFFLGPAVAIYFFERRLYKRESISMRSVFKSIRKKTTGTNILVGIGLGSLLWGLLQISFGNLISLIPSPGKWISIPLIIIATVFCFFCYISYYQPIFQQVILKESQKPRDVLWMAIRFFILNMIVTTIITIIPSVLTGSYLMMMFLIPMTVILGLTSYISTYYYTKSKDIFIPIIVCGIFVAMYFSIMSPIVWIPALFS
jgi:MFS family permease